MSHAASGVAWNTVAGDPLDTDGAHYELFFGYRDEAAFAAQVEQLVADRFASRLAAKDHTLWGHGRRGRVGQAARLGRPVQDLAAAGRPDRGPARGAPRPGPDPDRALRHGRLLARPGGDLRRGRCRARRARLLGPRLRAHGHRQRPGPHRRGRLVEVRRHRRDRQSAPRLREGVLGRRHRRARADHRGHRPGVPARPVRHRGRLPRLPRRPHGRRALLGADGVRPGAERAGRRRHRRAARRRPRRSAATSSRTPSTTPACAWAP